MTPKEALLFWLGDGTREHPGHRYDEYGQQVLANMTPLQIAHLDAWLAAHSSRMPAPQGMAPAAPAPGQPAGAPMPLLPGVAGVFTRALGSERRIEGAPIGSEVA